VQNVLKIAFPNNMFDIVISRGILISHIPLGTQANALKEIERISKPGSLIMFDYLHDTQTKKKYTKYSAPKATFDKKLLLALLYEANIRGKYFHGGMRTERVNRIAILRN